MCGTKQEEEKKMDEGRDEKRECLVQVILVLQQ
jgi:hypothetical protein